MLKRKKKKDKKDERVTQYYFFWQERIAEGDRSEAGTTLGKTTFLFFAGSFFFGKEPIKKCRSSRSFLRIIREGPVTSWKENDDIRQARLSSFPSLLMFSIHSSFKAGKLTSVHVKYNEC